MQWLLLGSLCIHHQWKYGIRRIGNAVACVVGCGFQAYVSKFLRIRKVTVL